MARVHYPEGIAKSDSRKAKYNEVMKIVKGSGLFEECDIDAIVQYVISLERLKELDEKLDLTIDPNAYSDLVKTQKIVADRVSILANALGLTPKSRAALRTRKQNLDKQEKKTKYFT